MKPLTQDELWLLDQKVAEGETVKVWLVWDGPDGHITALRLVTPRLMYMNDDPTPLTNATLESLSAYYSFFTNYWHAYAHNLKQQSGGR
jgi:hypothetical protein